MATGFEGNYDFWRGRMMSAFEDLGWCVENSRIVDNVRTAITASVAEHNESLANQVRSCGWFECARYIRDYPAVLS